MDFFDTTPITWHDRFGNSYNSVPMKEWGTDNDYKELMARFDILKTFFIDKGIPVIIGEAGIQTNYKNNFNSMRQFLYTLFSISIEYDGIMSCLWDIHGQNYENMTYYNRDTDKWNDEIIKDNLMKISKGKFIKSSDYYTTKNYESFIVSNNYCLVMIERKKNC